MQCSRCRHDVPAGAKFCAECGTALTASCEGCGTTLPAAANFCAECGQPAPGAAAARQPAAYTPKHLAEKILTSRTALEGERKQVTVLFADVRGSMELAADLDPEEWHRILDRFFQILADGVHRYEGTINQYTGDGIMALFGAPLAHEDHAQRACYAALQLRDDTRRYADELRVTRGLNFAVRMGLNSGEVVVGRIGDDLRMDYTAQGQTVGLAARMEQLAEPGSVFLTGGTASRVDGYFALRDLGRSALKGVREPVHVYALEGVGRLRTRLDLSRARGLSHFVGRAGETRTLELTLEQALAGNGQVVGAVGEAGVGKSRLCFEFIERCRARGINVYEGHCVAHGKLLPLLPILELLRAVFGVRTEDDAREARRKIAGTLVLLADEVREMLPLIFDLMGVPDPEQPAPAMDPEIRQRRIFEFVKRIVRARSAREPAVLFLDDLHWIDTASDTYLANWVEAVRGTRTLMLLNFRPEYRAPWMATSYYQQLPLAPLGPDAIAELLGHLLGPDPSLRELAARIQERAGGNPFFVEEIVQTLVEGGSLVGARGAYRLTAPVEALAIPLTVQAILATRIDRLPEREKEVLQAAAVVGRVAGESLLQQVLGLAPADLAEALRALVTAELLYEEALYPEAEYAFKHPLTQEVAYGSQLAEQRQRRHAAVAHALVDLAGERLDERAAVIAHHFETAGAAAEAADWHGRAAKWAGLRDAAAALGHWRRAFELALAAPESAATTSLALLACDRAMLWSARVGMALDEQKRLFEAGSALARRLGADRAVTLLDLRYHQARSLLGAAPDGLFLSIEEVKRLAARGADRDLEVIALSSEAFGCYLNGRVRNALPAIDRALALLREDPSLALVEDVSPYPRLLFFRLFTIVHLGQIAEAEPAWEQLLAAATEASAMDPDILANAHALRASLAHLAGWPAAEALAHARQAVEHAERQGTPLARIFACSSLGRARFIGGDFEEAIAVAERVGVLSSEYGTAGAFAGSWTVVAGAAWLRLGEVERARALVAAAGDAARKGGRGWIEIEALVAEARVLAAIGDASALAAARASVARAHGLVEETGVQVWAPHVHEASAAIEHAAGDSAARERALRTAHQLFVDMGIAPQAERVAAMLASSQPSDPAHGPARLSR